MSERRALLTDREREIIAGEADVKDSYRYQTISRVRSRFDRLESDLEVFREHGGLLEELQEIVCNDVEPKTRESHSTPAERSPVEDTVSPEPQQELQENVTEAQETDSITEQQVKDTLEGIDVTGRGAETKEVRRKAILHAWRELRESGEATTQELANSAFDEYADHHKFGYGESSNHYRGYTFWDSCARDVMKELPGVESPPQRGNTWYFIGEI